MSEVERHNEVIARWRALIADLMVPALPPGGSAAEIYETAFLDVCHVMLRCPEGMMALAKSLEVSYLAYAVRVGGEGAGEREEATLTELTARYIACLEAKR